MRLAIDASPLLVRSAGVKNYLYYWIKALEYHTELKLFPMLAGTGALEHTRFRPAPLALLHLSHYLGVDPFLRKVDIFHASNLIRKPPKKPRLTTTLHDLTAWRMPELHTSATIAAERHFAENVIPRAAGLIAVSEATKRDAVEVLGIDPARITVIYSGVSDEFFYASKLQRPRPYVLFVGTIEPRKNIDTLLDAWKLARIDNYDLVITGPAGWNSGKTMARVRAEAVYLGYVPEPELPSLTAGATAFVYPSLYEGFGFPVAQAMAAGVPVITSNVSSLPEITADSALLVDPRSAQEIANALTRLLSSTELRNQLAIWGKNHAQEHFLWQNCALRSLEFFRKLLP